jgi:predicted MPP superfamily phosphohydrolase
VVRALRDSGLIALDNQSHPIEYSGKRFWFLGTGSMLHGDAKLWECVRGVPQDEVRVLLAHEPDLADEIGKYKIDLQLSGHSHGGQIRFPGIGAMYLPPLGRKYPAGLYHLSTHKLYTNIGIGCIGIPVRLGCPPEITRITLRSKKS